MTARERDPWGDLAWSEDEAASGPGPDAGDRGGDIACPWCATIAADGATRCGSCGASLAQRETIGDLVIPGLTAVDPALKDLDGRPIHLRGPSPTQGAASGIIVAAAAGGPVGLAILGGVGVLAAAEYLGAGGDKAMGHQNVGEASDAVRQAVECLDRGETLPTARDAMPRSEPDPPPSDRAQSADSGAEVVREDRDGG